MIDNTVQLRATSFELFIQDNSRSHHPDFPSFSNDDTVLVIDFTENGTNNSEIGTFHLLLDPELRSIEEVVWTPLPNSGETLIAPGSDMELPNGEEAIFSDSGFELFASAEDHGLPLLDINFDQFGLNVNGECLSHQFIEELAETPNSSWSPSNSIATMRHDQTYANFMNLITDDTSPSEHTDTQTQIHTDTAAESGHQDLLNADGSLDLSEESSDASDSISNVDNAAVETAVNDSDGGDHTDNDSTPPSHDDSIT